MRKVLPAAFGETVFSAYFIIMIQTSPSADTPQLNGVLETALYVDDLVTARRFYADILQLELITEVEGRHAFFRLGDDMLLIFDPVTTVTPPDTDDPMPVPPHGATGAGHVCFAANADELDAWRKHLRRHAVRIEADFQWPNGARSIYFRDPAGNSLELADRGLWFGNA